MENIFTTETTLKLEKNFKLLENIKCYDYFKKNRLLAMNNGK